MKSKKEIIELIDSAYHSNYKIKSADHDGNLSPAETVYLALQNVGVLKTEDGDKTSPTEEIHLTKRSQPDRIEYKIDQILMRVMAPNIREI